jgi:hypothetical protein
MGYVMKIALRLPPIVLSICYVLMFTGHTKADDWRPLVETQSITDSPLIKSWSLLLICNPNWLSENQGTDGMYSLFRQFEYFGRSIGHDNLAIWFMKKPFDYNNSKGIETDIDRSGAYCARYKLRASDSPLVLVTTRHPDDPNVGDYFVVKLNGLNSSDSGRVLTDLADQMLVSGLNQPGLDSSHKWHRIFGALSSAMGAVGCYLNKVSISINAGAVQGEISHSNDAGCTP